MKEVRQRINTACLYLERTVSFTGGKKRNSGVVFASAGETRTGKLPFYQHWVSHEDEKVLPMNNWNEYTAM